MAFPSKSKLHKHLNNGCSGKSGKSSPGKSSITAIDPRKSSEKEETSEDTPEKTSERIPGKAPPPRIIKSQASGAELGNGFAFRNWTYAMIAAKLDPEKDEEEVCADTGCGVSLIDREWLGEQCPNGSISKMASPLRVRGVGSSHHETAEFVTQHIYLPAIDEKRNPILACLYRELHIVDNLRAKMLIGNDIIGPEGIVIDVANKQARIGSCNATATITAKPRGEYVRKKVLAKEPTIVPPRSEMILPTKPIDLPSDRDFLFEPMKQVQTRMTMFAHIVDHKMSGILVRNESNVPVQVPRKLRLGNIHEMDFESCFHTDLVPQDLGSIGTGSMTDGAKDDQSQDENSRMKPLLAEENRLSNGVMVYGKSSEEVEALTNLVHEFPDIWIDTGFVKVHEDEWMKLQLRNDWQDKMAGKGKAKIYPLGFKDREVIDKVFNELHSQGRLEWTKESTPFSFPVFVVWKGTKGRPVVDIRRLNEMLVRDAYAVPLQQDVIEMLAGCPFISVMDATSFFYQWRVHPAYRHMQTVVTHRGQETFNVPIMGNMNSIAYVQRQIDGLLRKLSSKTKVKAYVDDIVTGAKTFQEHLEDLRQLFKLFTEYNITVSPTKTFLGYPDVQLLGRKVNSLGLISPEEKLKAISQLQFPRTLGELEHYLGLTGYLRQYVHLYAQLSKELQDLKTEMLKDSPTSGRPRKVYSSTKKLSPPTEKQMASYQLLQDALSQPSILVHFDPSRTLWIDLDASKEFGFGAVVFHVKRDAKFDKGWPSRMDVEPIMFLSRLLAQAERNYWPTELEIAGIVWVLKKVRHMIESSKQAVRIQTDHSAIVDIMKQSSIVSTTSTMRMNTRLIRASQFLKQFDLDITNKPGKEHIIPDALSRLASLNHDQLPEDHSELDSDALFTATFVEMDEKFHDRLVKGYGQDRYWKRILQQVKENEKLGPENAASLPFCFGKNLPVGDSDPYFSPRPEEQNGEASNPSNPPTNHDPATASPKRRDDLLFHVIGLRDAKGSVSLSV